MENNFLSSTQNRVLVALVLFMLVLALGSYTALNFEKMDFINPMPASITVSGVGEVMAVPDIGEFSFSVNAEGADAATAQAESATKINAVLAYLKEKGVEDKDVKTQNYNLYPKWRYEERACPALNYAPEYYCPPGEQIQDGFSVSQTVTVKVRKIDTAGELISGVGEKGATDISSLNFTIDDMEALKAKAREAAIADAKTKAQILAKQLHVRLARIIGFYENEDGYYPMYYDAKVMAMGGAEESSITPAMPVGEETSKVTVNITYEIK